MIYSILYINTNAYLVSNEKPSRYDRVLWSDTGFVKIIGELDFNLKVRTASIIKVLMDNIKKETPEFVYDFDVYFEVCGKKMKTTVLAKNEDDAKEFLKGRIVFHKVIKSNSYFNDAVNIINDIVNFIK